MIKSVRVKNILIIETDKYTYELKEKHPIEIDSELFEEIFENLQEKIVEEIPVEFDVYITLSSAGFLTLRELKLKGSEKDCTQK